MTQTIELDVESTIHGEGILDGSALPGMAIVRAADGKYDPGAGTAGAELPIILKEDGLSGRSVTDQYVAGDLGLWFIPENGDRFLVLLKDGGSVVRGEGLEPDSTGKFVASVSNEYQSLQTVSAVGSDVLIRCRYVAGVATPPDPVTPLILPGLIGWWDASNPATVNNPIDGSPVTTWVDNVNGILALNAPTAPDEPVYKTGIQNGLNVIRYDGSNHLEGLFPSFEIDEYSYYCTAKIADALGGRFLLSVQFNSEITDRSGFAFGTEGGDLMVVVQSNSPTVRGDVDSDAPFFFSGVWFNLSVVKSGSTITIYKDGAVVASSIIGTAPTPSINYSNPDRVTIIGAQAAGASRASGLNGDMGETLLFDVAHTPAQVLTGSNYLGAKWAVP